MAAISTQTTDHQLKGQRLTLARIAWGVFTIATVVLWVYFVAQDIILALNDSTATPGYWMVLIMWAVLMPLGYIGMGLLLFLRRSDDAMAILSSLALTIVGAHLLSGVNNVAQFVPGLRLLNSLLVALGLGAFTVMAYVFPNGQFVPRWTRWPVMIVIALMVVLQVMLPPIDDAEGMPFYILMLIITLIGGLVAQVYRYRRVSSATQRQQTKWVLLGFAGPIVSMMCYFFLYPTNPDLFEGTSVGSMIAMPIFLVLALLLPAALALAILRYRLWDIDYLINRTLVYALMTLVLGGLFAVGFVIVRALLTSFLGGEQAILAAIVPTALVVGLFNPVRRWLRQFVDSKLYGINVRYATPPGGQAIQSTPSAPRTLFGPYADMEPVGSGGMAEVYRAHDTDTGRTVAIKVMPARLSTQDEFRRRFEREARTVSALKHPHIVEMYAYGEINNTPYMAMEYISGIDLSEYLHTRSMLSVDETRRILTPVSEALDYAHEQGVIHRDIKPSNVMLVQEAGGSVERVVLMDFGIAKITDAASRLTNSGAMGTFDYMAPEQIRDAREVDGRADVYGLAVVAYQMLTGQLPFKASNTAAVLIAHLTQPAPDPRTVRPDLPTDTARALLRALEKDPAQRFASAGALIGALG